MAGGALLIGFTTMEFLRMQQDRSHITAESYELSKNQSPCNTMAPSCLQQLFCVIDWAI